MNAYEATCDELRSLPRQWLITGVAGFIGSNLLQNLLELGQNVVGLDNFATGLRENLAEVHALVGDEAWGRFRFIEGDIRDLETCHSACAGMDVVLHQAALGSVPRSIKDPIASHLTNVDGTLNVFVAARDAGVQRVVYASSSSVYGDSAELPKREACTGRPLSPYALTKVVGEGYAEVFGRVYGLKCVGLRYFNVFGRRQDPEGPYSAVIPRWSKMMLQKGTCQIFGDGQTSRDFSYIANVVQANLLAATVLEIEGLCPIFNVSVGGRTTLSELHSLMKEGMLAINPGLVIPEPNYDAFRDGDITHSQADISRAITLLGYEPSHSIAEGLKDAMPWYYQKFS